MIGVEAKYLRTYNILRDQLFSSLLINDVILHKIRNNKSTCISKVKFNDGCNYNAYPLTDSKVVSNKAIINLRKKTVV